MASKCDKISPIMINFPSNSYEKTYICYMYVIFVMANRTFDNHTRCCIVMWLSKFIEYTFHVLFLKIERTRDNGDKIHTLFLKGKDKY